MNAAQTILAGQLVVLIVLGVLVGLGHDGTIQDALLAVSGAVAGVGLYQTVKTWTTKPPT